MKMLFEENYHTRTQDLSEVWHDAAQFYWGSKETWQNANKIFWKQFRSSQNTQHNCARY